jgi:arylsulfatase A-like enzyme
MSRKPPNIIVVVLDCVRAKSLRLWGGDSPAQTPQLDALARRGTTFRRAVAPANWTVPSHWSMMTGAYPAVHGMRLAGQGSSPRESIAAELGRAGYETALFSEQEFLLAGLGLESGYSLKVGPATGAGAITEDHAPHRSSLRGTDRLYSDWALRILGSVPPLMVPFTAFDYRVQTAYKRRICGDEIPQRLGAWLRTRDSSRPFHAFLNFVDAHEPYLSSSDSEPLRFLPRWYARTPRNFLLLLPGLRARTPWTALVKEYHRAISSADRKVGLLMEALTESHEIENTALIITSDHGQAFGEDGTVFHGNGATDAVTRVPLLVVPPEGHSHPETIDRWTSLCEVPAWVRGFVYGNFEVGAPPQRAGSDAQDHLPQGTVYCEGSPASDFGKLLRGRRPGERWNHRLLAAYHGNEKWTLDQDTGEVAHWEVNGWADDSVPGTPLEGAAARSVRGAIFAPYEKLQVGPKASTLDALAMEAAVAERLRSWGYD